MKPHVLYRLSISAVALFGLATFVSARPMDFSEVSLLVRAREPESSIMNDVQQRKLMHSITSQQENTLKSQGASSSLIQNLRNANLVVSKEDAAAFEAQRDQQAKAAKAAQDAEVAASENIHVFDVALGHPINLSQWGGYSREFAFYTYRCAGEDIVEAVNIDDIRTYTDISRYADGSEDKVFAPNSFRRQRFMSSDNDGHRFTPYDGRRDLKDDRITFDNYIAATSRGVSRQYAIDWAGPVTIKGVPYALYPVYAARGVSLYFISASSTSVRLAVTKTPLWHNVNVAMAAR